MLLWLGAKEVLMLLRLAPKKSSEKSMKEQALGASQGLVRFRLLVSWACCGTAGVDRLLPGLRDRGEAMSPLQGRRL